MWSNIPGIAMQPKGFLISRQLIHVSVMLYPALKRAINKPERGQQEV